MDSDPQNNSVTCFIVAQLWRCGWMWLACFIRYSEDGTLYQTYNSTGVDVPILRRSLFADTARLRRCDCRTRVVKLSTFVHLTMEKLTWVGSPIEIGDFLFSRGMGEEPILVPKIDARKEGSASIISDLLNIDSTDDVIQFLWIVSTNNRIYNGHSIKEPEPLCYGGVIDSWVGSEYLTSVNPWPSDVYYVTDTEVSCTECSSQSHKVCVDLLNGKDTHIKTKHCVKFHSTSINVTRGKRVRFTQHWYCLFFYVTCSHS